MGHIRVNTISMANSRPNRDTQPIKSENCNLSHHMRNNSTKNAPLVLIGPIARSKDLIDVVVDFGMAKNGFLRSHIGSSGVEKKPVVSLSCMRQPLSTMKGGEKRHMVG
jgi:hypothetical protein